MELIDILLIEHLKSCGLTIPNWNQPVLSIWRSRQLDIIKLSDSNEQNKSLNSGKMQVFVELWH